MDPILPPPPPAPLTGGGGGGGGGKDSGQKLRLMVSFGGHILPRPHDKSLFYAGGETRIIAIPRNSALSLSSLFSQIAKSFGSHNFTLKYQLPHHDLDSLISISSDEDLHNMIDEYDRLSSSSSSPSSSSRIRFFLFKKDEVIRDLKSDEDWFVDELKVAGSNPAAVDDSSSPESIVLESSSSFGSNSSSSNSHGNKNGGGDDLKVVLTSADSLGSDSSIPSPSFSQQAIVYQDASGFADSKPVSVNLIETESNASDRSPQSDVLTPVQVSGYMISKSMDHRQHPSPPPPPPPPATMTPHYIHHPGSQSNYVTQFYPSSMPVMYQTYVQQHQPVQYQVNKPYPVYMMPIGQTQNMYDSSMPCALPTTPTVATSQPHVPSNPVVVTSRMVYEGYKPAAPAPEYVAKVYRPAAVATQPVTSPPVNHPAQPVTVPLRENTNFVNEDPMHAQIYKTQPSGPTLTSQLPIATSAAAVKLSENFTQLQVENPKH